MPHLMYEWLERRARARWPLAQIEMRPLDAPTGIPWQRRGADGTQYVSFAEWVCPVNCIEPALCPATRGERTWSMPPAVLAATEEARRNGRNLAGPVIFHCQHRAYGVGHVRHARGRGGRRARSARGAAGASRGARGNGVALSWRAQRARDRRIESTDSWRTRRTWRRRTSTTW